MAFVKLDCGILNSTLWFEKDCRDVFITALLMAEPREVIEPVPQLSVDSLDPTGWMVPPGWYGFVPAAGIGIIHRAKVDEDLGRAALRTLGAPEATSRTPDYEGRRLVRIDGGYLVLNYMRYRDRDYTSPMRSKRYRERLASRRDSTASHRDITHADADTDTEYKKAEEVKRAPRGGIIASPAEFAKRQKFNAFVGARLDVPHKLHSDLCRRLGGENPDAALRAWYAEVDAEIEASRESIRPDVWKWLEARYTAWTGSLTAPTANPHAVGGEFDKRLGLV